MSTFNYEDVKIVAEAFTAFGRGAGMPVDPDACHAILQRYVVNRGLLDATDSRRMKQNWGNHGSNVCGRLQHLGQLAAENAKTRGAKSVCAEDLSDTVFQNCEDGSMSQFRCVYCQKDNTDVPP